ncbi:MAG: exosortase E/protease, VPEID-CTERM system [Candidatus Eremiobacteraeota bacterium]|nr:exosortase E/protease, VPEID-CTERM system [Candidatus Eremiobacteraeota bacterium]
MRNYELRTELRALLHLPLYHLTFSFLAFAVFLGKLQSRRLDLDPWKGSLAALHLAVFSTVALTLHSVWHALAGAPVAVQALCWSALLLTFFGSWVAAILRPQRWWEWLRSNFAWLSVALFLGALSLGVIEASNWLWKPLASGTMKIAVFLLGAIYDDVSVNFENYQLGTGSFYITIEPGCSGYEGIGLILIFTLLYLWLRRDQLRFPQALLLLPLGCLVNWLINGLRIAALVVIGTNFSPYLAMKGFHSQAGWLAFIATSAGLVLAVEHGRVFHSGPVETVEEAQEAVYPAAPFLLPLLAVLLGTMLGAAFTTDFPLLYPVRIVFGVMALLLFLPNYRQLFGRPNWGRALLVGVAVYVIWIALVKSAPADTVWPLVSPGLAWTWIAFRVLGSSIVVPLVEELAFRGYLQRRLQSEDFEMVVPEKTGWLALGGSSLMFGLLHQDLLAAVLAGLAYGHLYRKGGLSECTIAHGVTNFLISVQVLALGHWSLWV